MTKKSTFVPAKDLSKLWRAIRELDMLQAGDRILVGKYAGTEVKIDGVEHLIMREDDVLTVIE